MPKRAAIAMSGGVDSSVAAYLLQQQGYHVLGLFMRTGIEQAEQHAKDARQVADQLGFPFHVVEIRKEFAQIIDYFCDEYRRGRTPNPCIVCNRRLKFGRLFDEAQKLDAELLATGHYTRVEHSARRHRLRRGRDRRKDQSYFLFELNQDQLARTIFPNGDKTKDEVREIARGLDLPVKEKAESQEICFVPQNEYRQVLRQQCPDAVRQGLLRSTDGTVLGEHEGVAFFTIGQRRGLGIAVGEPRYVIGLDAEKNEVIVGTREELMGRSLTAQGVNWVSLSPTDTPFRVTAQIRYAHRAAPATVRPLSADRVEIVFDEAQAAITPGQAAVFYDEDLLLGGGWIE